MIFVFDAGSMFEQLIQQSHGIQMKKFKSTFGAIIC